MSPYRRSLLSGILVSTWTPRRRRVHEDSIYQHRPSMFLCTASDPQCATSSSSARSTHAGLNTCHHQVGPMQFSSCGYLGISAGPTAVRAECCRSACLLASDIGTHDSTAPGSALVTRTGANPLPVVCPGISLCAWHSTGASGRKPMADIRNRRLSLLCRLTDIAGAINSSVNPP